MEKAIVAQRVANQLASTENAIDAATHETLKLLSGLLEARQELQVSAVFGDDVVRKVTEAVTALGSARQAVIDSHNELAELKLRAGIRTKLVYAEKFFLKKDDASQIQSRLAG